MKANEIIRQRRKELQLTLKEVAERAGVIEIRAHSAVE